MKKREEAIREIEQMMIADIKKGCHVTRYDESASAVGYHRERSDDNGDIIITFTPPKPEFKKGTIGLDQDSRLCFYKELNSMGDYVVCSYKKNLNGTGGYKSSNFTPVYQTDPIEKLAFELVARVAEYSYDFSDQSWEALMDYYKSKAKKKLSK